VIAEAAGETLTARERGALVRQIAVRAHPHQDGSSRRYSRGTVDRWLPGERAGWRAGGLAALMPAPRADTGTVRAHPELFAEAAALRLELAALLPIREQIHGPERPGTLATRDNLAYWTGQAGDAAGARDQYAALLPIREQIQGPQHPRTLATRMQLARWTGQAGMRPGPATSTPPCCPSASRSRAPSTPAPWPPATTSPTGPGRRGMRLLTRADPETYRLSRGKRRMVHEQATH
jgi:hypothetical protein